MNCSLACRIDDLIPCSQFTRFPLWCSFDDLKCQYALYACNKIFSPSVDVDVHFHLET